MVAGLCLSGTFAFQFAKPDEASPSMTPVKVDQVLLGRLPTAGHYHEGIATHLKRMQHNSDSYRAPKDLGQLHPIGQGRSWYSYAPADAPQKPRPAVMLLHGDARDGRSMLDMWKPVADQHGLILIAPNAASTLGWSRQASGVAFQAQVLAAAQSLYNIDSTQVFLSGHSKGAELASLLVNDKAAFWRAIAVHGGYAQDHTYQSQHGAPFHAYLGEYDHLYSLKEQRAALRDLQQAGHDTKLSILPEHNHGFYANGRAIAHDMWLWMTQTPKRPPLVP
jgi:poly(3-hydroxybutyrate) depolymerase